MRFAVMHAHKPGRYSGASWLLVSQVSNDLYRDEILENQLPEHQAASDTANATKCHKSRAAQRTLPLTTDVVCLVSHTLWNVAVRSSASEKDAEVASSKIAGPAHARQTDDGEDSISDQEWPTNVVLVAQPCCAEHHDACKDIRWRNEALLRSFSNGQLETCLNFTY